MKQLLKKLTIQHILLNRCLGLKFIYIFLWGLSSLKRFYLSFLQHFILFVLVLMLSVWALYFFHFFISQFQQWVHSSGIYIFLLSNMFRFMLVHYPILLIALLFLSWTLKLIQRDSTLDSLTIIMLINKDFMLLKSEFSLRRRLFIFKKENLIKNSIFSFFLNFHFFSLNLRLIL